MNDERIEQLLRKAPRSPAPAGMLDKLRTDIALPRQVETRPVNPTDAVPFIRRWFPAISFAAIFLACIVAIEVQTNQIAGLKHENATLRTSAQNLEQLRRDNAEYQRLKAEHAELERLRRDFAELQQLHTEVAQLQTQAQEMEKLRAENQQLLAASRQLREQKPAWDKLRAENQRLRVGAKSDGSPASGTSQPANMIAKERLSDAGFGSPEAAIQTLFWALCEGNIGRIRNCFSEEAIKKGNGLPIEQAQGGAPPMMAGFKSFRVVVKKAVAADQVELGIQIFADETLPVEVVLPLKRVDGEWKVNMALSP